MRNVNKLQRTTGGLIDPYEAGRSEASKCCVLEHCLGESCYFAYTKAGSGLDIVLKSQVRVAELTPWSTVLSQN
jgi:hypothetical protein